MIAPVVFVLRSLSLSLSLSLSPLPFLPDVAIARMDGLLTPQKPNSASCALQ